MFFKLESRVFGINAQWTQRQ